jgi:hypothetical protein
MADFAMMVRLGIGLYLLVAGLSKVVDMEGFVEALGGYRWIPSVSIKPLSWAVPATEIAIAAGLIVGGGNSLMVFALAGAALMVAFAILVAGQLQGGRAVSCGCLSFAPRKAGWGTVIFDLALAIALVGAVVLQKLGRSGPYVSTPAVLIGVAVAMTFLLLSQLVSTRQAFESFQQRRGYRPASTPIRAVAK